MPKKHTSISIDEMCSMGPSTSVKRRSYNLRCYSSRSFLRRFAPFIATRLHQNRTLLLSSSSSSSASNESQQVINLAENCMRVARGRKSGGDGKNNFGASIREFIRIRGAFSYGDLYPWFRWMDVETGLIGRTKKLTKEPDIFLDQIICEHLAQRKHDDAKDMFLGGKDTTATTIQWVMAELVKNTNLMKKAQEEVRRVVGKKSKVDNEDFTQMDYLKCI